MLFQRDTQAARRADRRANAHLALAHGASGRLWAANGGDQSLPRGGIAASAIARGKRRDIRDAYAALLAKGEAGLTVCPRLRLTGALCERGGPCYWAKRLSEKQATRQTGQKAVS